MNRDIWKNIKNLEDYDISYLLYREGKTIEAISIIRNQSINKIEQDIIKSRVLIKQKEGRTKKDFLLDIMSLTKNDRIEKINSLTEKERGLLINEIYTRYTNFKTVDDRMILIWLIGELDSDKLLPFLRMELQSNRFNQKRLACSALGKLARPSTRIWLHDMIDDDNPQVRQYAIKALKNIGDMETVNILKKRRSIENKDYVKLAIDETIDYIIDI